MNGPRRARLMVEMVDQVDARGLAMSPSLPESCKNYLIDIDGTVCEDVPNEQPERMEDAELYDGVVEQVNNWHAQGHFIYFFSSRTEEHREVTDRWLEKHGFHWHGIGVGKPRGGNYHWIEDHVVRATRFRSKLTDFVKRWVEVEVFDDDS